MQVIELFKELLRFKSITPDDDGALNYLAMHCADFEAHFVNVEGVKNLFLTKVNEEGPHLAFAGHIDVVPPGEGWDSEPFTPTEKEGFIYARGAQDMKAGLAAFISAATSCQFKGRLSILITSDEEGDAKYGTCELLKVLKEKDLLPDFVIVGEPTCNNVMGDTIKCGRKGSINGEIIVRGKQGHIAYPDLCDNAIHKSATLLKALAGFDLDPGCESFTPSKIVLSNINAGLGVDNVAPGRLSLRFNVRNSPHTSLEDVREYVQSACKGVEHELILKQSSKPFLTDKNLPLVQLLKEVVEAKTGVRPELNTKGGTSDARFIHEAGVAVVEFGVRNDSIHAVNERVAIEDVLTLKSVYEEFLKRAFS